MEYVERTYRSRLGRGRWRSFTVTVKEKQRVEGKKRPVIADVDKAFSMDNVKYTKYLLSFK